MTKTWLGLFVLVGMVFILAVPALAEQVDPSARFTLGLLYHHGQGFPQDYAEAMKWYRLAAEQGHASAQNSLGVMYRNGQGVPEDDGEAIRWYLLAADQGSLFSKYAQYALGEMYSRVKGVKEDLIQAHMWFTLAAANSHSDATEARDKLILRMTSTQVATAQRLAREWEAKGK